jgi:subtilisin family serine protease
MNQARMRVAVKFFSVLSVAAFSSACTSGTSTSDWLSRTHAGLSSPASAASASAARSSSGGAAITLITGDRVRLRHLPDGATVVAVEPAPGRGGIGFFQSTRKDGNRQQIMVVPSDAAPLLAAGRLDPRLFNITELERQGFADERRATLPLIVTYSGHAPFSAMAAARTMHSLPSINGDAIIVAKENASAFWNALALGTSSHATSLMSAGIAKVWLDGKAQLLLDQSVPQIGAPQAWSLGLTGKGVTVALLDTGVALDHPDLAGKVALASDFTGTRPDGSDDVGHGTHCAGIITGSGAASQGKYKGVAPDVTLIVGKVCMPQGCDESAIIAGMQWAAPLARVVSLSLGGGPSDGTDPLSQAVNHLTAQYGTLFVIAAGNAGAAATVSSPAAADAALAVGSVSKQDVISDFSSRGPRIGDYAVKPDIAAPGGDIVSARAKGTPLGDDDPINDYYCRMSGTSMATPHVAGAAAILAELHPNWRADQLKAALMSTSKRLGNAGIFDEGAGRVDVARAVTQLTYASAGSVSFGSFAYPHNEPSMTKTITYHNDGNTAVSLTLSPAPLGPDGKPAPSGLFQFSATQLTVAAHGTADVGITFNPALLTEAGGLYGGLLSASDGSNSIDVAFDAFEEPESYDLTVQDISRAGGAPLSVSGTAFNAQTGDSTLIFNFDAKGKAVVRLPKGIYDVSGWDASASSVPNGPVEFTLASQPDVDLSRDTAVTWDCRLGQPLSVAVDRKTAVPIAEELSLVTQAAGKTFYSNFLSGFPAIPSPVSPTFAVPTKKRVKDYTYIFGYRVTMTEPLGSPPPANEEAYSYNLAFHEDGRIPRRLSYRAHDWELASLDSRYHSQGSSSSGAGGDYGYLANGVGGAFAYYATPYPSRRREYYTADGAISWYHERSPASSGDESISTVQFEKYSPGPGHAEWNRAPLGPAIGNPADGFGLQRAADFIVVSVPLFSASEDNHMTSEFAFVTSITGTTTLTGNGSVAKGQFVGPGYGYFQVPPDDTAYTLTATAARQATYSVLGTQASATWTFHSKLPAGTTPVQLPLMVVRAAGLIDDNDVAPAGELYLLALHVETQPGAPATVTDLGLEVSYDDGQSWQTAPVLRVADRGLALLVHPSKAGFVSLRASARDAAGNTATHTTIRAYAIAPRPLP